MSKGCHARPSYPGGGREKPFPHHTSSQDCDVSHNHLAYWVGVGSHLNSTQLPFGFHLWPHFCIDFVSYFYPYFGFQFGSQLAFFC